MKFTELKRISTENMTRKKTGLIVTFIFTAMIATTSISASESNDKFESMVVHSFVEEAIKNNNWKIAFATAKNEQVVFMNISPLTNPKNEIGMEVHAFDQMILIVKGKGKAILNGKTSVVKEGDMVFIPEGIPHNVINLDKKNELKLISIYSETDIPKGSVYKKKADEPKD